MKKVLTIIAVVLLIIVLALGGFTLYRYTHIFVEDAVYAKNAEVLDLRGEDISVEHYLTVREQLPNCQVFWDVPFQGYKISNDVAGLKLTSLTEQDRAMLPYFTNLQAIDASACKDYAQLAALREQMPKLDLKYSVDLGGYSANPDTREVTIGHEEMQYDVLMENLTYLTQLEQLVLSKTQLTLEQIDAIHQAYPDVAVDYTVGILDQEYASNTEKLDLSAMTSADVEAVCTALPMLPGLTEVELMNGGSTNLELKDVKALNEACPEILFHYTFTYNGKQISTTDKEVRFTGTSIGTMTEEDLRLMLDVMEDCDKFVLEYWNYGSLTNEMLGQIREEYRDRTKLVWRVFFGVGYCLTDVDVLRCTYDLSDGNSAALAYCEDVRFVDFGHDTALKTVDFMAGMKKLEVVILSGSMVQDLTPLAGLPNLRVVEVSNCGYLTDVSPLAQCPSLKMLNISFTAVEDVSALDELDMELMCAVRSKMSREAKDAFAANNPECLATYEGNEYGTGWRYLDNEKKRPWYEEIVVAFKYPHAPNMAGWYL
jgi:hypothetical protein